jgi:cytochrome c oxidase assembly protein subunit 15
MVVLGGVTRLTGSGLSMVDWRPATGILPPLSDEAWQETFEMYQQSPEFREVNAHMDVNDFKGIFWLEFLHRLLGRLIGVAFLLPFVYFLTKGYIQAREWPKYTLMFVLGGMQGVLGWYMVKSGLVDDPHVSQYRLTAHLVAAFLIYAYMFWIALSLLYPSRSAVPHVWFGRTIAVTALITLTVISGGFVAGQHVSQDGRILDPARFPGAGTRVAEFLRQHGHGAIRSPDAGHHDLRRDRVLLVRRPQRGSAAPRA